MHKILSYLLLCTGLLIILFALNSMYKVFIQAEEVVAIVHFADLTLRTQAGPVNIPMEATSVLANMGLFAAFMLFVLSVGGKIASLGVQLLKNERIYEALLQLDKKNITQETLKKL